MNTNIVKSRLDISVNISPKSFLTCKTSENSNKKNLPIDLSYRINNKITKKKQRVFSFESLMTNTYENSDKRVNKKIKKRRRRNGVKKKKYDVKKNMIKIKFIYLFKKSIFKCQKSVGDLKEKIFDILKKNDK